MVILLDHGNSLNVDQLELTKAMGEWGFFINLEEVNNLIDDLCPSLAAKQVVSLLSDTDYLHLIAISDKVTQFMKEGIGAGGSSASNNGGSDQEECHRRKRDGLFPTTMDNKVKVFKFIEQLNKTKGEWPLQEDISNPAILCLSPFSLPENTNHSLGFQAAFDFLSRSSSSSFNTSSDSTSTFEEVIFLYVSRGLLSLAEAKTVLETIATGQSTLPRPIVINTCAIIIGEPHSSLILSTPSNPLRCHQF